MPPRRRPTAFEVSFPELAAEDTQDDSATSGPDGQNNRRRPHDGADHDHEVSVS